MPVHSHFHILILYLYNQRKKFLTKNTIVNKSTGVLERITKFLYNVSTSSDVGGYTTALVVLLSTLEGYGFQEIDKSPTCYIENAFHKLTGMSFWIR